MNKEVEIKDKVLLTIDEASELFNIGKNKIRNLISLYRDANWLLTVGRKTLIKRSVFEDFVLKTSSI